MNAKKFKEFLSLFAYADDDKKKTESIEYIIHTMNEAESTGKVLDFTKLEDISFSPNPLLDRNGKLLFNTQTLLIAYNEYLEKCRYIKTEVANLVRENYLIMRDISTKPLTEASDKE